MQEFTEGTYFNGHSSLLFKVYVGFTSDNKKIVFESPEVAATEWRISDLTPNLVGSRITLRLLLDSEKVLTVDDGQFVEKFFDHYRKIGRGSFYHRYIHAGSLFHISIVLGIVLLISAGYFLFHPMARRKGGGCNARFIR